MECTKSHLQHGDKVENCTYIFTGFLSHREKWWATLWHTGTNKIPKNVTMIASNDFWIVGRYFIYDTLFSCLFFLMTFLAYWIYLATLVPS